MGAREEGSGQARGQPPGLERWLLWNAVTLWRGVPWPQGSQHSAFALGSSSLLHIRAGHSHGPELGHKREEGAVDFPTSRPCTSIDWETQRAYPSSRYPFPSIPTSHFLPPFLAKCSHQGSRGWALCSPKSLAPFKVSLWVRGHNEHPSSKLGDSPGHGEGM